MEPVLIVIISPKIEYTLGFVHRHEPVLVQILCPELAVERFNKRVFCRLSWPAEVKFDTIPVSPQIQTLRNKLRSIVHANACCLGSSRLDDGIHHLDHIITGQPSPRTNRQALTAKVIAKRQHPVGRSPKKLIELL